MHLSDDGIKLPALLQVLFEEKAHLKKTPREAMKKNIVNELTNNANQTCLPLSQ